MSKKPRPIVPVTVKLSPELADKFYEIANNEFGGNISEAVREAIKLLISREAKKLPVYQFQILEDSEIEDIQQSDGEAGTELKLQLELTEQAARERVLKKQ